MRSQGPTARSAFSTRRSTRHGSRNSATPRSPASERADPDDPDRRSYHLAFWAADEGGSLELVRREGEWSIGIVYADSLANWKTVYDDPEAELACGNVQPWG